MVINKFLTAYPTSTNTSVKAVAYLMDTNQWSIYAGNNAEYAIGCPTLELLCESYKDTHPNKYVDNSVTNSRGYGVKLNTSTSYISSVKALELGDFNSIYVKTDTSKANGTLDSIPIII